jgi:membrane protease YdiL (CAAX protease family)
MRQLIFLNRDNSKEGGSKKLFLFFFKKKLMVIIRNFRKFLVKGKVYDENIKLDRTFIFSFLFLKVLIVLVFALIKYLLSESILSQKNDVFSDTYSLFLIMNVVAIAPIFEEMIFRYHLNISNRRILVSSIFAFFLLYDELIYLFIILIYFTTLLILFYKKIRFNKIIFVYISSTIFAFFHLMAYPDILQSQNVLNIILMVSPHFAGGLLLSYVFFRNGIVAGIALHSLWNFIPYVIHLFGVALLGVV